MEIEKLIESLKKHRDAINGEMVQKIDFDQLEKDLSKAESALSFLEKKEKLGEELLSDFKAEIKRMALVVSRAKGDLSSCSLVEKLLLSPDLGLEDLHFLRDKVREEFNQCFPSSPQSKVVTSLVDLNRNISEFKTGAGAKLSAFGR